jgi:hypothetical protein
MLHPNLCWFYLHLNVYVGSNSMIWFFVAIQSIVNAQIAFSVDLCQEKHAGPVEVPIVCGVIQMLWRVRWVLGLH